MGSFAWTPDSRTLLAVRTTNKGAYSESIQIWKVPIDGSAPAHIDYPEMRMAQTRLSPEGQTIAFTSGRVTSKIFVLESLPHSPAARSLGSATFSYTHTLESIGTWFGKRAGRGVRFSAGRSRESSRLNPVRLSEFLQDSFGAIDDCWSARPRRR